MISAIVNFLCRVPRIPCVLRIWYYRRWNPLRLRMNGISIGPHSNIINKFFLFKEPEASISIGECFTLTSGEAFNPICRNLMACLCARGKGQIVIGNHVGMSSPCIWSINHIRFGNHVLVGGDCLFIDNDAHNIDAVERRVPELRSKIKSAPIIIEDEVFIGAHSIVLKGVTIGARSVIGAGSVVTESIPADSIAAGNPCRVIRKIER
ncbi:MAG: acyltransferase [Prevotella sp.]|nr:acyltransferase [Prevotella sp.]